MFRLRNSTNVSNDSIAASKAWDTFKSGYMDRKFKNKGFKNERPVSSEENLDEYNEQKKEFYYDTSRKKLKLIPTDDGEKVIPGFKEGLKDWQLAPNRNVFDPNNAKSYSKKENKLEKTQPVNPDNLNPPGFEARVPQAVNMTPNVSEEEAKAVRDKFDATYMKSNTPNPINHCGPNHKIK